MAEFLETYGVFAAEDNSVGVVICNYEDTTWCVNVNAESGRLRKYRLVEDEAWKPIDGGSGSAAPGQRPSFYKDKKVKGMSMEACGGKRRLGGVRRGCPQKIVDDLKKA